MQKCIIIKNNNKVFEQVSPRVREDQSRCENSWLSVSTQTHFWSASPLITRFQTSCWKVPDLEVSKLAIHELAEKANAVRRQVEFNGAERAKVRVVCFQVFPVLDTF